MSRYLAEEMFLRVEENFSMGNFAEGKRILEEILEMEPGFGRAHNHLGWIYFAKFEDFTIAASHFELAMKFEPDYPAAWLNYISLLLCTGKFAKLEAIFPKALEIEGIHRFSLFNYLGQARELSGDYAAAAASFKEALKNALYESEMKQAESSLERLKTKRGVLARRFSLFSF